MRTLLVACSTTFPIGSTLRTSRVGFAGLGAMSCREHDVPLAARTAIAGALSFLPTPYCSRMVRRKHGGEITFRQSVGNCRPRSMCFGRGRRSSRARITVAHIEELRTVLRRKPLIWDNLHANDYDARRFYCGPYAGRPPELRNAVSGLLSNPNCEFALNYVPLRTLAQFIRCDTTWNPRKAYLAAMREWLPRFATVGEPVSLEDLILFGDCYYLPHEEGPEAETLYECVRDLLREDSARTNEQVASFRQKSKRLREFCSRVTELRDRSLFYALSRRVWICARSWT
jgi:protein O-GlcNAcase/histone acetyltransferase